MSKKSKLHELLAVEGDLEGEYRAITQETINTFSNKAHHFVGSVRELEWFEEGQPEEPKEYQHMTTTVKDKLDYTSKSIIRYFDALLQKESTNQVAKADLVVDGVTIAKDVPATMLLGLENRLKVVRDIYMAIPTLPPNIEWKLDPQKGPNIYSRVHAEEKMKTEKIFKVQVLYEAKFPKEGERGESLPAQVEKISETKNVGVYKKNIWTGILSPAEKSVLLGRVDKLIRATKKARQQANSTEVVKSEIGKAIFDFIHAE